jgi:phosphoglycolate phosphatase-like HAD superfamily hydrolase
MNLKDFAKQLSEFYDEMKTIANEAVGGFAIDSPTPPIRRNRANQEDEEENEPNPLEEGEGFNRIMIDFDKTIYSAKSGWNDGKLEDDPFPDAKKSIEQLKNKGYEIVIFSTRASEKAAEEFKHNVEDAIQDIKNYLINNGIYFDRITGDKIAADFYIDDKAVHIKNGNWKDVISQIKKREKSL